MHVNKFRGVKYYQTYILFVTLISDQAKIYGTHRIMIAPYELQVLYWRPFWNAQQRWLILSATFCKH